MHVADLDKNRKEQNKENEILYERISKLEKQIEPWKSQVNTCNIQLIESVASSRSRREKKRVTVDTCQRINKVNTCHEADISLYFSDVSNSSQSSSGFYNRRKFIENVGRRVNRPVNRNPSPHDFANMPTWCGDISKENPTSYLESLFAYLSCMGLNNKEFLSTLKRAVIGHVQCIMWLNRTKIKVILTFVDFS